jgi:hypothetical protein
MQRNDDYALGNVYPKPMHKAQASAYSYSLNNDDDTYRLIAPDASLAEQYNKSQAADQRLKYRIRVLKLISRVIALIMSILTLVPITMTLVKFLLTRNTTFMVDGKERTAWAQDTIVWYTYMYFGVSLISALFNLAIVVAYCRGVKNANNVASVASWWSYIVLGGHVLVWIVSVAIYRYGKQPVAGKFRDLWGWTCSPAADAIQNDITNINFGQYCTMQVSFCGNKYTLAEGLLTLCIVSIVVRRTCQRRNWHLVGFHYLASRHALEDQETCREDKLQASGPF